jgi:hypothetical protein
MSELDSATETVAVSTPVALPTQVSDPQGSTPASEVPSASNAPPSPEEEAERKQRRSESKANANLRRENRDLQRAMGRLEERLESISQSLPRPEGGEAQRQGRPPEQSAVDRAFVEHADSVLERIEDAGEEIEGFDKVLDKIKDPQLPINRVMLDFLAETDKPAHLAQWFADNPDEVRRISRLSDAVAVRALERAEAKLAKPAPRKTSSAPPPPPTVGGRSTASFDPDKASMEEYAAYWKDRQAKR